MIITAADPNDDPMTRAVKRMAETAGGGDVFQYAKGSHDFSKEEKVLYLGHGEPGGDLKGIVTDDLIADLAHPKRGLQPGASMIFWSCYAATGTTTSDSILVKTQKALLKNGIAKVTILGIPGALYTNTVDASLWSAPVKPSTVVQDRPLDLDVITGVEVDVWIRTGLCVVPTKELGIKKVTISGEVYDYPDGSLVFPPFSTEMALDNLRDNKKLTEIPSGTEQQGKVIADALQGWYKDFFSRDVIRAYIKAKVINPWSDVVQTLRS